MLKDVYFSFLQYFDVHPYLIPLGVIGIWRWGVWMLKEIIALFYRPTVSNFSASVSIVTPVYNEDPEVFAKALASWQVNKPYEIIAVIDYTDKVCISSFKKFAKTNKNAKLFITKIPGKRPALALGIKKAKGKIVALVDSDTLWAKDVIKNGLPPFIDRKIGGVATYQNVFNPKTLAQKIFDIQLDLRYRDEMPFLAAAGNALVCLSGRTAFYRRDVILPMLPDLVNETFFGRPVVSGDDKRLTYLVLAAGWKVKYQNNSHVYTPGMASMYAYMQQRLRWSRNSLRADLRAVFEGWPLHHPALLFFQIDKVLQSFTVILSPIYFIYAVFTGFWQLAGLIFAWWIVSRTIRLYPHLRRRPQDIVLVPAFIFYSFFTGILKVYAFFTLNTQGWITRWHKKRMTQYQFIQLAPAYAATAFVFLLVLAGVAVYKYYSYFLPMEMQTKVLSATIVAPSKELVASASAKTQQLPAEKDLLVKKYIAQPGDTFSGVAAQFGISTDALLAANIARVTNWNNINPGFVLNIPGKDQTFNPQFRFNYQRIYPDVLQTSYDAQTNTITVSGRGLSTNLTNIKDSVGEDHLKEVSPGVWFLTANLSIRSGVTLTISKDEASWLKLLSRKDKFVMIQGYNATILIDGVKITSWDDTINTYDTNMNDKRSFILVKNGSRMDIYNSELAYLGYPRALSLDTSPYGVSWRLPPRNHENTLLTGEILNSKFHNNYFGVYTFGATGMQWKGNEFYDNVRYGFDPHDDSNGALIENNVARDNGSHGFIISKRCMYNTFRNNISYNNKLHGIMLHEKSDHNVLENNTLYGNTDGLAIWHSSDNIIRNNTFYGNKSGIRANVGSNDNMITQNKIYDQKEYGVYLYDNANNNSIVNNAVHDNKMAFYIKTKGNVIMENNVHDNAVGVYLLHNATNNTIVNNMIYYDTDYGIHTKLSSSAKNYMSGNDLKHNKRDIYASLSEGNLSLR